MDSRQGQRSGALIVARCGAAGASPASGAPMRGAGPRWAAAVLRLPVRLVFLVVAGSLVDGRRHVLRKPRASAGLIAILVVVGRPGRHRGAVPAVGADARRLVEATRRVEAGDYTVRVSLPSPCLAARAPARPRLRHDGRPARDRRAPAADAAGRRQPRAADAADRRPGQPRGDHRRRLPGRRGAPRPRSSTRRASWRG